MLGVGYLGTVVVRDCPAGVPTRHSAACWGSATVARPVLAARARYETRYEICVSYVAAAVRSSGDGG
jgi:hypothetical protein